MSKIENGNHVVDVKKHYNQENLIVMLIHHHRNQKTE